MEIKNILVPVDFSDCSKNALKVAIDLAQKCGAKIHMVNSIHIHSPHPDISGGNLINSLLTDYEDQIQASFNELESDLIELKNIPHESDRFIAYLVDAIFSETQRKDIDLIVMGTRSDHSNIEKFVGSNTTDIIRSAKVPVLVIPESAKTFGPQKIGLASDFEGLVNFKNLEILTKLSDLYNSEILIFHVAQDPTDVTVATQKKMKELHEKFLNHKASVRTIEADTVINGVKMFTSSHKLDLLSVVPKEHNFFEKLFKKSISKTIALNPSVPLLTIPQF
ncbi:MAG: universal stress protein [Cyclobacteriaceae bacterium]|nr:universal stress protein [Cyclobacteriaceae bacterium SS2]